MPTVIGEDYLKDEIVNYRNKLDSKLYVYFKSIGFDGDYIRLTPRHLMNVKGDVKDDVLDNEI